MNNSATHITFEEMSDYIFSDGRNPDFLKHAARINRHVMTCEDCKRMYLVLMDLKDKLDAFDSCKTEKEKVLLRVMEYLYTLEEKRSREMLVKECLKFKLWLSFGVQRAGILARRGNEFTHPRLKTVMKSSVEGDQEEEVETVLRSSVIDGQRNRVSIGLDGTLSLYFDAEEHAIGQRVLVLPEDEEAAPQMLELTRYDDRISYVRFEGIQPGEYTVVVEEAEKK